MKNLLVLFVSTILSVLLVEAGLRLLTHFPVNFDSNMKLDPLVGYRLSTDLEDVDNNGFRNSPDKNYQIAAVGDSHTYGSNVLSQDSWPAVLESMTGVGVYNFGVGSYGIFSYHAIIKTQLRPGTRGVIVGLYPANDFSINSSYCKIDLKNNPFWKSEITALQLDLPVSPDCVDDLSRKPAEDSGWGSWLAGHSAFLSALDTLVISKLKHPPLKKAGREISPAGLAPIAAKRTKHVDLALPEVMTMYGNLDKFAGDWALLSQRTGAAVGVLLIPSVERVVYEHYRRETRLDAVDPHFVRDVRKQIDMEERIVALLDRHGLRHENALDRILPAFEKSMRDDVDFYPNGHPLEQGYRAYAEAALELWNAMMDARR